MIWPVRAVKLFPTDHTYMHKRKRVIKMGSIANTGLKQVTNTCTVI